jgi:ABC-type thiamine transport system ATPase subunit
VRLTVKRESVVHTTPRVQQMAALFDVPPAEKSRMRWDVNLPIEEQEWNVGLLVGPSGAGKSTIAREVWGDAVVRDFEWPGDRSVLDGFPERMGIKEVVGLLGAVGFSSPPSWMRPYHVLSMGEQFRVTVARALAETTELVVLDEFTSVVDRQVAKVASSTVAKAVRKAQRQLVAVTCHYDVVEWLQPDWVYQPATGDFTWRSLQRRPEFHLEVYPVDRSAWRAFRQHHYLSGDLHHSARCWGGFVDGECVASPKSRNLRMGHRLVVLPDWQGLGIGGRLDDWLGQHLWDHGYRYRNTVAHPAMVAYYTRSPRWRQTGSPRQHRVSPSRDAAAIRDRFRDPRTLNTHSFEYVAPGHPGAEEAAVS